MIEDPDRLSRVHVVQVRAKGDGFVVVLSDKTEVSWDSWIRLSQKERWGY
jgi:hypothetical protein